MKVKLTKIESTHSNLRTDTVEGMCTNLPEVGMSFVLWSEPLTTGHHYRQVATSPVQSVEVLSADVLRFKTLNSIYELATDALEFLPLGSPSRIA